MKSRFKKVYVLAPYLHATGGVELSHQLVDYLNRKEIDSYIVYIKHGEIIQTDKCTPEYEKYSIKIASKIEDSQDNILMVPEIYCDWLFKFEHIQYGCWWMSVDNHYKVCAPFEAFCFPDNIKDKIRYLKNSILSRSKNTINKIRSLSERTYHFYQSKYAQYHLYDKKMTRVLPLGDYINTEYLKSDNNDNAERKNIVLYNPAKGLEFTKKLIKANPNIDFIALKGLSRDSLKDLMKKAKIYIDFGNFPGKDRLPRESVMNGLCVVTGVKGASGFYEDLPIDSKYKIKACKKNIRRISKLLEDILNNFDEHISAFTYWQTCILKEENEFYEDIDSFFCHY